MTGTFYRHLDESVTGTNEAQADSVKTRDGNGDSRDRRTVAEEALVSLGGLSTGVATKMGNFTAAVGNHFIPCNASGGAFTITLPAANTCTGRIYTIKKTDSTINAVTVDGNLSETIDGAIYQYLTLQNESITIESDGTGWLIHDRLVPMASITKSATFTVSGAASVYLCTFGSAYTVNLPPAAPWIGKKLTFVKVDAAAFGGVLDGDASENVNGATTKNLSSTQWTSTDIYSDGTQWITT